MIKKMKPEAKEEWVAALRSKKYTQAHGRLSMGPDCFCVMGLLCEISRVGSWQTDTNGNYEYHTEASVPLSYNAPIEVLEWAFGSLDGMTHIYLSVPTPKDRAHEYGDFSPAQLNDGALGAPHMFSFEQLADLIEEQM